MSAPTPPGPPYAVDDHGGYFTEWWCGPPAVGEPFVATDVEWVSDTVRRIYDWTSTMETRP